MNAPPPPRPPRPTAAALAVSELPDGRSEARAVRPARRGDDSRRCGTPARRAVAECPIARHRRRCRRGRLLRRRGRRAVRRPAAPSARRHASRSSTSSRPIGRCSKQFDPKVLEHDLDPRAAARPGGRGDRPRGLRHLARHPRPGRIHRRDRGGARRMRRATRTRCAGATSGTSASAPASTRCRSSR